MELHRRICLIFFGTLMSSCHLLCNKLDGYKFPVYSTQFCPRNQTEWNERSSAINCTKDNGYVCFPNEKFTQLLEFCYTARFIWIQEGYCLYLKKDDSTIYSYSCSNFHSGCHNSPFPSYDLFKHTSCTSIGNGCFLAEPSCKGTDTTTQPPETTKSIHVERVSRNANNTLKENEFAIIDEMTMIPVLYGVLISISFFFMMCIIYKKGIQHRKKQDDEEHHTDTALDNSPLIRTDERDDAALIVQESSLDRAIFEQWQEDNSKFVSTRACKEVEKLIKRQNLVVVTGNSGSGKTAIIQHIALCYRSQGWMIKPIYSVKEIIDALSREDDLDRKTLLVFNDPIGNESFDEEKYNLWKDHEEKLKGCLRKIKMLISCRRYILNDVRIRGILKDTSYTCIIDLSDDQHKLDNEEKHKIWEIYSSKSEFLKEDINEIIETEEYFPLLCKLYFSDKNKRKMGLRFFKEPFDVCQEEIRYFRTNCKEKYCSLVLLVLFNNQLCMQDIRESKQSSKKFKLALKLCGIPKSAPYIIDDTLKTIRGFFVKKIDDTYHFYHDFVMEVTTYVFGTDNPLETIQYADIGFLRRRVNLESCNDQNKKVKLENLDQNIDKFTICLNDKYVRDLGERLFNEIFGERMLDVVLNPCMRNEKVATFFIQKLKDSPDKLDELLAKKQLQKKFRNQEDNQALKQSYGSKLEFLYYKDKVSILSAIIAFCHTKASKHCLETLQRMQNSLKGTSLFSVVCCNGSMDLFNVFPKEQIKTLLMEKWGQYYPIHIVSLFHNHEILKELIQVKNEVNLSTSGIYRYTPLMLAAINADTSEKNNQESKILSINITVELLLNHGADINLCQSFCGSPLHIACSNEDDYIVQLLLSKGADINSCDTNKQTPLHTASFLGRKSIVQLLLNKGADINARDTNKQTPIHKAIMVGSENTIQLLLDKGADINSCDKYNETPLHKAIEWGYESTVQLLLDKGADINACDRNKETPLHKASAQGHERIVQLLLDKEADINACDTNKETPLHKASAQGHKRIVQLLLDKGADMNLCDTNKESLLHDASEQGLESTVQLLLDKAANINSLDTNKHTPLH